MCGLAGYFCVDPGRHGDSVLESAAASLAHRGPDGRGWVRLGHAGLAHTRLAVIDPAGGVQPMRSVDGLASIVFNGEIYNYRELRDSLLREGCILATHSDTEVVLALYQRGGVAALSQLRGMYAFALWDERQQQGVIARDPIGIKPLFMAREGDGTLRFASEAKAIVAQRPGGAALDAAALHLLLNFRYIAGDSSLFAGISQLPAGTAAIWTRDGSLRTQRLPPPGGESRPLTELLADSVRAHLTSDVPVGVYLSGGIDSATVAALALRAGTRLPAFTLAVGDDPAEARNAASSARLLGLESTVSELLAPRPGELLRLLWHLEAPKINAFQSSRIAALARTRVKVVLSGLGGDELFYGYNAHRWMHRARQLRPAAVVRRLGQLAMPWLDSLAGAPYSEGWRAGAVLASAGDWPHVYGLFRNLWDSPRMRRWLYGPRMLDQVLPDAWEWLHAQWPSEPDPLRAMAAFEWQHKMVNDLLWHEDRASMAHGLEVRVPFADARLASGVALLQRDGPAAAELGKRRLRAAAREWLPADIMDRPKSGFQLDAPGLLAGALAGELDEWLSPERVRTLGMFDPKAVAALRALPARGRYRWHYFLLWQMVQVHQWLALFEEGMAPPGPAWTAPSAAVSIRA